MRRRLRPGGLSGLAAATASILTVTAVLGGCASTTQATAPIRLGSAYVIVQRGLDTASAYLVISNAGAPDRLLRVTSSVGGPVLIRGASRPGSPSARALSSLMVPGHKFVRLDPSGVHLVISRPGQLHQGRELTLTLVFARAGTMRVTAQITDIGVNGASAVNSDNS